MWLCNLKVLTAHWLLLCCAPEYHAPPFSEKFFLVVIEKDEQRNSFVQMWHLHLKSVQACVGEGLLSSCTSSIVNAQYIVHITSAYTVHSRLKYIVHNTLKYTLAAHYCSSQFVQFVSLETLDGHMFTSLCSLNLLVLHQFLFAD